MSKILKVTKASQVQSHLTKKKYLTSWQAIELYGETRLSARIYVLRKRGWSIQSVNMTGKDRLGNDCRFVKYVYTPSLAQKLKA
jgi:hypothetical protein